MYLHCYSVSGSCIVLGKKKVFGCRRNIEKKIGLQVGQIFFLMDFALIRQQTGLTDQETGKLIKQQQQMFTIVSFASIILYFKTEEETTSTWKDCFIFIAFCRFHIKHKF